MNAEWDPLVAGALAQIAPPVAVDADQILAGALARVPSCRRSRRGFRRTAVLAFAILVLAAGAALAAEHFDLLPWLRTGSNSTARYSVDVNRRFSGPVPSAVRCAAAGRATMFTCVPTTARFESSWQSLPTHVYDFSERIPSRPILTRAFLLRRIDQAEARGIVSKAFAGQARRDVRAVEARFFDFLNVFASIGTTAAGTTTEDGPGGTSVVLVPPEHVPVFVVCAERLHDSLVCRNLAQSEHVPVGAAVYDLLPGSDWQQVAKAPNESTPPLPPAFYRQLLGHDLTTETRLLIEVGTQAAKASGAATAHASPPVRAIPARRKAGGG
jgi:hypothetical protein